MCFFRACVKGYIYTWMCLGDGGARLWCRRWSLCDGLTDRTLAIESNNFLRNFSRLSLRVLRLNFEIARVTYARRNDKKELAFVHAQDCCLNKL